MTNLPNTKSFDFLHFLTIVKIFVVDWYPDILSGGQAEKDNNKQKHHFSFKTTDETLKIRNTRNKTPKSKRQVFIGFSFCFLTVFLVKWIVKCIWRSEWRVVTRTRWSVRGFLSSDVNYTIRFILNKRGWRDPELWAVELILVAHCTCYSSRVWVILQSVKHEI